MKKTLIALILSAAIPAIAQTAVSAPGAPTIPAMQTVTAGATAALANTAVTNRVFIDQSGANPNVNVTQEGSGNAQGDAANPIYLRGTNQTLVTKQVGNLNSIMLEVVNATTGAGVGATVTIQQIGNSNIVDAACGYGNASDGSTSIANGATGCKAADLNWKFTGNSNDLQYRGGGSDLISHIDATGNSNVFRIDQLGDKHSQLINLTGDSNTFNITQSGGITNGSHIVVSMTTSNSNTVNISQTGAVDNYLNLKTAGTTSGTFNIVQKP
jgi:hypothetical protein